MAPPKRKEVLTQEFLRDCFNYNADTGECIWIDRPRSHFANDAMYKRWSGTKTGRPVGCVISSGSAKGYILVKLKGKCWYLHRLIFTWMTGRQPFNVDHANLDRGDNRWCNLREASLGQNCTNVPSRSASGYKGVYQGRYGGFRASITHNKRHIRLGTFPTALEAARAYDAAAKELHGEFAVLNLGE